jgi:hypothetical protein
MTDRCTIQKSGLLLVEIGGQRPLLPLLPALPALSPFSPLLCCCLVVGCCVEKGGKLKRKVGVIFTSKTSLFVASYLNL